MQNTPSPAPRRQINTYTLLAVTALSVSNLIVGLLQDNTLLILASAVIAAAFAALYAIRTGMFDRSADASSDENTQTPAPPTSSIRRVKRAFPLWLFLLVMFVLMPGALLFLQSTQS